MCRVLFDFVPSDHWKPPIRAPGAIVADVNGQSAEDRGGCGHREQSGGPLPILRHRLDPEKHMVPIL